VTRASQEEILGVIDAIYGAALEPGRWPVVIGRITELLGGKSGMMLTSLHTPEKGGFYFPYRFPENYLSEYAERYHAYDVWTHAGVAKNLITEGTVATDEDLVPHEEYLKSRMFQEFGQRTDIVRLCVGVVFGTESSGVLPTVVSVYRGIADPPFGDEERALHAILVPHLSRALGIMFRLRDADLRVAASLASLDRLASGVILFGARRAVHFANRAARRMLGEEDGLRLRQTPQGKVTLAADAQEVQREIDGALDTCLEPAAIDVPHFSRAVLVGRPSGRAAYVLNLSALPVQNEFGGGPDRPLAIAFLADPAEPVRVDEAQLERLYGLTPAECRVAAGIAGGQTLEALAATLGVSENTVKSQLQSVYDKLGVHRQAQLAKLLLSLASTGSP
jgi:DNA-binding CsgD family transcriptional regulator